MSRRHRILTPVAAFLMAGAIINVAVAWGCVGMLRSPSPVQRAAGVISPTATAANSPNWVFVLTNWKTVTVIEWRQTTSAANANSPPDRPAWSSPPQLPSQPGNRFGNWLFIELGAGWPFIGMGSRGTWDPAAKRSSVEFGLLFQSIMDGDIPQVMPLRPVWPGFAINTFLYAAILWIILALPGVLRRRSRIKRGMCPACAYPIGTSAVCTECGSAVTPHVNEAANS